MIQGFQGVVFDTSRQQRIGRVVKRSGVGWQGGGLCRSGKAVGWKEHNQQPSPSGV